MTCGLEDGYHRFGETGITSSSHIVTDDRNLNILSLLYKSFWVFTRLCCLVSDKLFGTACESHHQGLYHIDTLMMRHTSSPETLVPDQTTTPGKNPKTFVQDNRGESLNLSKL
jgi:hypothetical protein